MGDAMRSLGQYDILINDLSAKELKWNVTGAGSRLIPER